MKFDEAFSNEPKNFRPMPLDRDVQYKLHPTHNFGKQKFTKHKHTAIDDVMDKGMKEFSAPSEETFKDLARDVQAIEDKLMGMLIPTNSKDKETDKKLTTILQAYLNIKEQVIELNQMVQSLSNAPKKFGSARPETSNQFD